jgi:hypothetical protein
LAGKVLILEDILEADILAKRIADRWLEWDMLRAVKMQDWAEVRRYVYATDTTATTNSQLPWKNKTTIPKLCQIRDNLQANYMITMFPQRKWLEWEANEKDSNSKAKRDAITNYMNWVISQPSFKHEVEKIVLDYIDYGNCFATVKWVDERAEQGLTTQAGYVGPAVVRISPTDIVMNPVVENFGSSPKMIKSIISLGEVKDMLQQMSNDENRDEYEALWDYLKNIRSKATSFEGEWIQQDEQYRIEGFSSFRDYLRSDYAEILTFYGDLYDPETETFLKNHVITVVDRHKVIGKKPNPSFFGTPPIFHAAWRKRQDNLWGMGPLDNLVGMQYRIDHVENMKADVFDLITYPVQKVKGFVEDFTWQPGEKIFVSEEGDVDLVVPDVNALNANFEIQNLERLMEEMAGAPREAMGFRTPGEKTKYEVQRLENAAARLFQNKIKQFEEQIIEPLLNAMLELARRNMTGVNNIKVFNDEFNFSTFQSLSVEDITGIGRIKPVAARHFAEQAELMQNLTNLSGSPLWQTVAPHFSGIKIAKIIEEIFNIKDYEVVMQNVALTEQAEAQKQMQALEENMASYTSTASGIGEDFDLSSSEMEGTPPQQLPEAAAQ